MALCTRVSPKKPFPRKTIRISQDTPDTTAIFVRKFNGWERDFGHTTCMQRQAFVRHVFSRVLSIDGGFASMADQVCVGEGGLCCCGLLPWQEMFCNFVAGRHPAYRKGTILGWLPWIRMLLTITFLELYSRRGAFPISNFAASQRHVTAMIDLISHWIVYGTIPTEIECCQTVPGAR